MRLRRIVVVSGLVFAGCSLYESGFPEAATPLVPPPQFQAWWDVVQRCSGERAPFSAVSWYEVPGGELLVRGEPAAGAWFAEDNRIVLQQGESYGPLVRHEMLHAILRDGSHPPEYFQSRCRDMILCGRGCALRSLNRDPTPVSIEDLDIAFELFPLVPSLGRTGGRVSAIIWIRNPTPADVYVSPRSYGLSTCHVGVVVSSVADPLRSTMSCEHLGFDGHGTALFRPGETRGIVVDVDLRPAGGQGPFQAEPIAVGAVLGDNVRVTQRVLLRP